MGALAAGRSDPSSIADSAFGPVVLFAGASAPPATIGPQQSPNMGVIRDPWLPSAPAIRAQPPLPGTNPVTFPVVTPAPTATPKTQSSTTGTISTKHRMSGAASYYCRAGSSPCTRGYPDGSGFNAYAAAGPRLRAALGAGWRGKVVLVDGIRVKLIDWCQCYQGESNEKLLDLYYDVFARTGSSVTIRW